MSKALFDCHGIGPGEVVLFMADGSRLVVAKTKSQNTPTNGKEASQDKRQDVKQVAGVHSDRSQELCHRRGPNTHPLPVEKIQQLSLAGLSVRDIAEKLSSDGTPVNYRTVQRRLVGVE